MRSHSKSITDGFTFIEALVGISFITITGGILLAAFFSMKTLSDRSSDSVKSTYNLLQIIQNTKSVLDQINPPYWVSNDTVFVADDKAIRFYYVDTVPEKWTEISFFDPGGVKFTNEEGVTWSLKSPVPLKWELWKDGDRILGLNVIFNWLNKDYVIPLALRGRNI